MYVHVSLSFKNSHSKIHGIASSHGIDYSTDCVFDDGRRQLYLRMTISRAIYIRVGERMALKTLELYAWCRFQHSPSVKSLFMTSSLFMFY